MTAHLLTAEELEQALRALGFERYHHRHPFHRMMHAGGLSKSQFQAWVLNRFYYQSRIPAKDATLLARLPTPELRREWRRRLADHDGTADDPGGIARWLALAEGVGLPREMVESTCAILPGTRFAVDAYVAFVRDRPILDAVASSLTELFSPDLIAQRTDAVLAHYPWIDPASLAYFRRRLDQAPRDSAFALDYVKRHAVTADAQRAVLDALTFKCDVLWAQLDALHHAYVEPAYVPPGAFRAEETE